MSRSAKFCDRITPILRLRQWDLDALLQDLGRANQAYAMGKEALSQLQDDMARTVASWKEQANTAHYLHADTFLLMTHYLQDLACLKLEKEATLAELAYQRDVLIDQITIAQRRVDIVKNYQRKMEMQFTKRRLSDECKTADDHWSTLHGWVECHEN